MKTRYSHVVEDIIISAIPTLDDDFDAGDPAGRIYWTWARSPSGTKTIRRLSTSSGLINSAHPRG